jgi:hypothetical protein
MLIGPTRFRVGALGVWSSSGGTALVRWLIAGPVLQSSADVATWTP